MLILGVHIAKNHKNVSFSNNSISRMTGDQMVLLSNVIDLDDKYLQYDFPNLSILFLVVFRFRHLTWMNNEDKSIATHLHTMTPGKWSKHVEETYVSFQMVCERIEPGENVRQMVRFHRFVQET